VLPPNPITQFDHTNNEAASVTRLAWLVYTPSGEYSMVLCCGLKYHLLTALPDKRNSSSTKDGVVYKSIWRELFEVPIELAYCPPTAASLPSLSLAIITMGPVGVVINARGEPVGSSLHFDESSIPQTLSWGGGGGGGGTAYILAASNRGGVDVYDFTTGQCVQYIDLALSQLQLGRSNGGGGGNSSTSGRSGSGLDALPSPPSLSGAGGMTSGRSSGTGTVAIISKQHDNIWLCQPISIKEQVVTHLTHGDIDAALSIVEASLLLMNVNEDIDDYNNNNNNNNNNNGNNIVGGPSNLLGSGGGNGSNGDDGWVEEAYAQAGLMLLEQCDFDRALGVLERCRPAVFQPSHLFPLFPTYTAPWITDNDSGYRQYWKLHRNVGKLPSLDDLLEEEGEKKKKKKSGGDVGGIIKKERAAILEIIAQYLFRVRIRTGIDCVEGIDTLLFCLFAELEAEEQATAFAALPNCANIEILQDSLEYKGWWHALATLLAVQGSSEEALQVWKHVLLSSTVSMNDDEDSDASKKRRRRRQEALDSTVQLLQTTIRPGDDNLPLLLGHLSWLFQVDVQSALRAVATATSVPPQALLSDETALPPGSEARWQYLHYVITVQGSTDASLHTSLALELIDAVVNTVTAHAEEEGKGGGGEGENNNQPIVVVSKPRQQIPIHTNHTTNNNKPGFSIKERYKATTTDPSSIVTMRSVLLHHLETSPLFDATTVMDHLKKQTNDKTSSSSSSKTLLFCEERAAVCAKMGDHDAALILLALYLRDVAAAEAYARTHLPPAQHSKLLDLLLNPAGVVDSGVIASVTDSDTATTATTTTTTTASTALIQKDPLWEDACWLISVLGDAVDALALLKALPPSMPLTTAENIVIPMLQDRIHRKRMSQMMKAMHTAKLNSVMLTKVKAERRIDNCTDGNNRGGGGGLVVDDDKACMECHLRLGGRVFVVLPGTQDRKEEKEMKRRGEGREGEEEHDRHDHDGRKRVVCFSCYQRQNTVV